MAIRKLNYTGRQRIKQEHIDVFIDDSSDNLVINKMDLSGYNLPNTARVCIEAYFQSQRQEIDFGTVEEIASEKCMKQKLPDKFFDIKEIKIQFRIKVTSSNNKKLLAVAEIEQKGGLKKGKKSLLPVHKAEFEGKYWYINFEDSPVLEISNKLPINNKVLKSDLFKGLVYPAVFREILFHISFIEHDVDDDESWQNQWLNFAKSKLDIEIPQNTDPQSMADREIIAKAIDNAVDSFSKEVCPTSIKYFEEK